MTNEEAIKVLKTSSWMCLSNNSIKFQEAIEHAYNNLKRIKILSEENAKLKAEIEQLKDDSKIVAKELVTQIREIERLKSELETCKNRQVISEKERMIQGLNDFCDKFEMCNQCIFYGRCADYDELSFEEIKSQLEEAERSLKGTL